MLTISFPSLSPGGLAALISFFVVAVIYLSKLVFALGQLFIFGVRRTGHEWTSLAAAVYGSPLSLFMEGGNPARLGIASKNRPSSSRAVMITIGIATLVALGIGPITQLGLQTCNYNELISADLDYKLSTRPVLSQVANRSVDFDQLRSYRSCPPCTGQSGRFTIDPNYFKTFKELQGPMQLQYTQITDKLFSDGTNGLQAFFESIDLSPSAINSEYVNGMVASREEGWFTIQPIPVFPEDSLKDTDRFSWSQRALVMQVEVSCIDSGFRHQFVRSPVTKSDTLFRDDEFRVQQTFDASAVQFNLGEDLSVFPTIRNGSQFDAFNRRINVQNLNLTRQAQLQAVVVAYHAARNQTVEFGKSWAAKPLNVSNSGTINRSAGDTNSTLNDAFPYFATALNDRSFYPLRPINDLTPYYGVAMDGIEACRGYAYNWAPELDQPNVQCVMVAPPLRPGALSGTKNIYSCAAAPAIHEREITVTQSKGNLTFTSKPTGRPLYRLEEQLSESRFTSIDAHTDPFWGVVVDPPSEPSITNFKTGSPSPIAYEPGSSDFSQLASGNFVTQPTFFDAQTANIGSKILRFVTTLNRFAANSGGGAPGSRMIDIPFTTNGQLDPALRRRWAAANGDTRKVEGVFKSLFVDTALNMVTFPSSAISNTVKTNIISTRPVPCYRLAYATQVIILLLVTFIIFFATLALRDHMIPLAMIWRFPPQLEFGRVLVALTSGHGSNVPVENDMIWQETKGEKIVSLNWVDEGKRAYS